MEGLRYARLTNRQRATVWMVIVALLLGGALVAALSYMRPILISLAKSRVSNTVNRIVVAAVNEAVASGEIDYSALVAFEKDGDGRVTALRSNMAEVNRLQTAVSEEILRRLSEVSTSELRIPIGTLSGSALLAGRGPSITVRMQAVGSTNSVFRNVFTASGINQTRHQILLNVDVFMSILLPGLTTSTKISNEIAVAETIIVGNVPDTYTYFSTTEDKIADYADEYIMNNG